MKTKSPVIKQLISALCGEALCTAIMLGVYAIIGLFSLPVLYGALFGCAVACANFFALTVTVSRAADRAAADEAAAAKAKLSIQASSAVRLLIMAALYFVVLKSGVCDPVAAILPLLFIRIGISVAEFFLKEGEKA